MTKMLDQPELYTRNLEIGDIVIFADTLGTMTVDSHWSCLLYTSNGLKAFALSPIYILNGGRSRRILIVIKAL